jgi:plasmid replication initiation protein
MKSEQKPSKSLIVKSNKLIEAGYRLTLVEQRIILLAIAESRRTGKGINGEDFVRITTKNYAQQFEVDDNNAYLQLKEARKSLFSRQFTIYQEDQESGCQEVVEARWLSAASYIDGAGAIKLQFSMAVVPYITHLEKEFTIYRLEKISKMSSAYAIRLYELFVQWGSIGKREIEMEWLRKVLKLDNEYSSIKDFKKWVIDVAIRQINEFSDLTASYTQRKTGRNVTHLIFTFAFKTGQSPKDDQATPVSQAKSVKTHNPELLQRLRDHGIGTRLAATWIQHNESRVLAAIDYVESRVKQGHIKGATAGYLRTVFEDDSIDFGKSTFQNQQEIQAREAIVSAQRSVQQEADAKRAESDRRQRQQDERARALAWFEGLAEEQKQALEAEFLRDSNNIDIGLFKRNGHRSMGFCLFVKKAWMAANQPI